MSRKSDSVSIVPLLPKRSPVLRRKFTHLLRYSLVVICGIAVLQAISGNGFLSFKGHGADYYKKSLLPFSKKSELSSKEAENLYLKTLDETNYARDWLLKFTNKTHLAGTNYELVEWTKQKFEEFGLSDVSIKPYYVYLNFPKDHALTLLKGDKEVYSAPLQEDELPEDPSTYGDTIPTFHGYSANGNVTAQFFYANYGRREDFAKLEEEGVDMKGKIAIVRYGGIYRGLKVKFAQEQGSVGVLIYSDPGDDGELTPANGYEQYPKGPARQESAVQRGSVLFLSYGPGDPTTPGYSSSSPDVERKDPYGAIPKIPSLPISYREVKPILAALNNTGLKSSKLGSDWEGKLEGYDYSVGPSPEKMKLNLFNEQIYNITPIWNVLGEIEGVINDEVVLVGNHRDAWAGSAGDPNSGSTVILEITRSLNELQKKGWKPFRRIVFASFDGEEPGLLGSTEWGEELAAELQAKVVAYLNLDVSVTGNSLVLQSSPVLNDLLFSTAESLNHPKGGTLLDSFKNGQQKGKIGILGSGSDYTVFLEHLGIPSVDMGFSDYENKDPIYHYHSNYDSFYWMENFADPGFVYHNLMSKYLGSVILKLSDKEVIQFKLNDYSLSINEYFNDLSDQFPPEWNNRLINQSVFSVQSRRMKPFTSVPVTYFNQFYQSLFNEMENESVISENFRSNNLKFGELVTLIHYTIKHLAEITAKFDQRAQELQEELDNFDGSVWKKIVLYASLKKSNFKAKFLERHFLNEEGLKGRNWFKHIVYASGRYTGYEGQSLPGIREALEDKDFDESVKWMIILWKTLTRVLTILSV